MKNRSHVLQAKPKKRAKQLNAPLATASIVTALSVAERSLGFLYRIVLSRLLGAEGLGMYQVSLSLFSVFLTLGTGGIPITVSRLISKSKAENNPRGERGAVSAGVFLCLLITVPALFILLPFGQHLSFLFSDARCIPLFKILLLGLIFSSLYAVFRGYFWGNKSFLLPSVLEIAEETVMVIVGVLLLQNVSSPLDGATKAAWAVVLSYLFSFTVSTLCFFGKGGKLSSPKKQLKPLFNATLPITSVRASGSLVNSAVAILLPAMLIRAGVSETGALELFGVVSGMAIPILFIPSTIIGSLSLVLVPDLSESFYRKNTERLYLNIKRGLSVAFLVSCFLFPFFFVLGEDLGALAFSNALAGELIKKGASLLLPLSLTIISTGMLNSMGFERQTLVYYFLGAAALLLCVWLLPPVCGAFAYILGLIACHTVNALCNLWLLGKKCKGLYGQMRKSFFKKALAALLAIFPICLFGTLARNLFIYAFGGFLAALFTALTTALFSLLLYWLLGLFSFKSLLVWKTKRAA